jgi:hypothetical protein
MWRALETGSSLKIYAPALDPTGMQRKQRWKTKNFIPVESFPVH